MIPGSWVQLDRSSGLRISYPRGRCWKTGDFAFGKKLKDGAQAHPSKGVFYYLNYLPTNLWVTLVSEG
jgi:hypothetical protein